VDVLAPIDRGELGAGNLNQLLQDALTPGADEVRGGGRAFRTGDRVMQMRNDYDKEVFNGDVGHVVRVLRADEERDAWTERGSAARSPSREGPGTLSGSPGMIVKFDDREVRYGTDELDELQLAYAATVHKSQGSEYPAVVVPVHTQHFVMLQRNLLYTAVTRGKRLVVLVGTRKALGLAVRNAEIGARGSRLAWRLATR
jgi:exodeoxyribonuclease V alpha subunit